MHMCVFITGIRSYCLLIYMVVQIFHAVSDFSRLLAKFGVNAILTENIHHNYVF